jgi:NAD(P)-dependent dehydrogenase (short-subunit alcohol dehydrogenase family)
MRLAGQVAILTGASGGLGQAVAAELVREGADVVLVARDAARLGRTAEALRPLRTRPDQQLLCQAADVSVEHQVRRAVGAALEALGRVDVLVCAAGVHGPIGLLDDLPFAEWARAVEVNLFGSVLCCQAVLPSMRRQGRGKIVLLSGGGATRARPRFSAYAASKAALVRFGETLAEELAGTGIEVNAVAPGRLDTPMLDDLERAGRERVGEAEYEALLRCRAEGGVPLSTPARLVAFLASSDSDGISGRLLSAVWDDWAGLPAVRGRLAGSDVYTLRRVEPADRGFVDINVKARA